MLIIIRSGPDTADGRRGLRLARDTASDIALIQGGVYYAQPDRMEGFCGTVYALDEDLSMRGIGSDGLEKGIKLINYGDFVDLMADSEKVLGLF